MKKFISLFQADLKNIFRDQTLIFLFFMPLIFIAILRFAIPPIQEQWQPLSRYYPLLVAMFCLLTASFPAFLVAFIMLDEKELNLVDVFRVMPVSSSVFITYRLAFTFLFGFLFASLVLIANGLINYTISKCFLAGASFALITPIIYLTSVIMARNKIEGMSVFKVLNLVIFIPLIGFLLEFRYEQFLAIIPVYWTLKLVFCEQNTYCLLYLLAAVTFHGISIGILYFWFRKKIF